MPCTGSAKSADSTMLSCLSPRSPCCGPNAALSFKSPSPANASSECTSSRVTDAGWASNAMRLPASGRRRLRSSSSRSRPNFIDLERECFGVVEVRLARRVAQRPVRKRAIVVLQDRGEAKGERAAQVVRREAREVDERIEVQPPLRRLHRDLRVQGFVV